MNAPTIAGFILSPNKQIVRSCIPINCKSEASLITVLNWYLLSRKMAHRFIGKLIKLKAIALRLIRKSETSYPSAIL